MQKYLTFGDDVVNHSHGESEEDEVPHMVHLKQHVME